MSKLISILKSLTIIIVVAAGVYFLFMPDELVIEADIVAQVVMKNQSRGVVISGIPVTGLEVRIQGPKSSINKIKKNGLKYTLDLSDFEIGEKKLPILAKNLKLPQKIQVVKLAPAFLNVCAEIEIRKEISVEVALTGKPASGRIVTGAVAKPMSVLLCGPEKALAKMEIVKTKPIDVSGFSESFRSQAALDIDDDLNIVPLSGIIYANVFIRDAVVTKKISDIPLAAKNTKLGYTISPGKVSIEIKGPALKVASLLKESSLDISLDLNGLGPGVYVRRASITMPVGITLTNTDPEIFTVTLFKKKEK